MTPDERRAQKKHRDERFRAMMADSALSDSARVLGAFIYLKGQATEGGWRHEIAPAEFACVGFGCPSQATVSARLRELSLRGYVKRSAGGKGHSDRFEFAPVSSRLEPAPIPDSSRPEPRAKTESDDFRSRSEPGPNFRSRPEPGPKTPSLSVGESSSETTPPPPPPTAGARERAERGVEDLRALLGPRAEAVDAFAAAAAHPDGWAGQILGWYRPPSTTGPTDGGGTQLLDVQGVPAERIAAVIATAMTDYALKGRPLEGRYFRGFVRSAADEERTGGKPEVHRPPRPGGNGYGRKSARPFDDTPETFTPTEEFTGFKR